VNVHRVPTPVPSIPRPIKGRGTSRAAGKRPRVPLVVTDRALGALATLRTTHHAWVGQALGLVAAPGGQIGLVLDVPATEDQVFARGGTVIFFVAAALGARLDGRVLDRGGPLGHERFVLGPARRHILATEDDPVLHDLLTIVLEEEGYRLTFSSAQSVAEVAAEAPDLLLLDGRGQGADSGWAFLERLKADPATAAIPVLVLTALGREADAHAARLVELDTVLVHKPFDLDDLLAQVRHRLAGDSVAGSSPGVREHTP
jgi:CheY-like chemotaxis protein